MFIEKIAKEIKKIETKISDNEQKLDYVFDNYSPEDDGAMESVMTLSENITFLKEKKETLEKVFWNLV